LGFLLVGKFHGGKPLGAPPFFQHDLAARARVADPLRLAARRDEKAPAAKIQDVDGIRIFLAALSSADDEKIIMRQSQAEPDEKAEEAVEDSFDGGGWIVEGGHRKYGYGASFGFRVACFELPIRTGRNPEPATRNYFVTAPGRRAPGA